MSLGHQIMNYFYVPESEADQSWYYGSTSDLVARLKMHNAGRVKSTKSKKPYKVIYYEAYSSLKLAKRREQNIKNNWAAKAELKKRIK
jgi:putative endonuclease